MSNIGNRLVLIAILIVLNSLLSLAEAALLSSRKARLQQRINEGKRGAQAAMELVETPNRFLSTIQVGITTIDVLTGAIGAEALGVQLIGKALANIPLLAPYSTGIGFGLGVLIITYLSIVLGELVPKRLALKNPEQVSSIFAKPMTYLSTLLLPLTRFLGASTDFVLRLAGVGSTAEPPVTEEELLVQLDQGTQAGVFEEAEQDMVEGVFSLSDRRVNALMTPRNEIHWLDVHDTPDEIRRKLAESPYSRFPVADDSLDHVIGIVKAKNLLLADTIDEAKLREMCRPPLFIPETAFGSHALEMFRQEKRELMLVVDEFGVVQGLITLADILEEIVGDFEGKPQATQRQDGSWLLDGMLSNDDFKEIFNLRRLPDEEEYETLGGFVMNSLRRVPVAGDFFEWQGLRFEVVDMDGKRVDKVLVSTLPVVTGGEKE